MADGFDDAQGFDARARAEMYARKIREYWAARGYDVTTTVTKFGFHSILRTDRYEIASNTLNGWPSPKRSRLG